MTNICDNKQDTCQMQSKQIVPFSSKVAIIEFFTIGLSDTFLSDYLTDLKLHRTK